MDSGPGTSFACPIVSGVIALMLEARSELTWRDVQGIIATTSTTVTDSYDTSAKTNSAGFWHSDWYVPSLMLTLTSFLTYTNCRYLYSQCNTIQYNTVATVLV